MDTEQKYERRTEDQRVMLVWLVNISFLFRRKYFFLLTFRSRLLFF